MELVKVGINLIGKAIIKNGKKFLGGGNLKDRKINKEKDGKEANKKQSILLTCEGIFNRNLHVPKSGQNHDPILNGTLWNVGFGKLFAL